MVPWPGPAGLGLHLQVDGKSVQLAELGQMRRDQPIEQGDQIGMADQGLGIIEPADTLQNIQEAVGRIAQLFHDPDAVRRQPDREAVTKEEGFANRFLEPLDVARNRALVELERLSGLRSEEHTSELQSLIRSSYAVFCLKKQKYATVLRHSQKKTH